jgi:predicted RNA-binding protein YlqC (UPF0109 family)
MLKDIEFLEYVVKSIVDYPESVKITRKVDEKGVFIVLQIAQPDMGRIIGKQGKTASAIRAILHALGGKLHESISLKIVEETVGVTSVKNKDLDAALDDLI